MDLGLALIFMSVRHPKGKVLYRETHGNWKCQTEVWGAELG